MDRVGPVAAAIVCTINGSTGNIPTPRQIKGSIHKVSSISGEITIIEDV